MKNKILILMSILTLALLTACSDSTVTLEDSSDFAVICAEDSIKAEEETSTPEEPMESAEEPEIPEAPIDAEKETSTPEEPIESTKEPEIPEEPIEVEEEVSTPEVPIESDVEPSVSVESEESSVEIIIPDIPLESFSQTKPSEERDPPDPSTFTDTFTIDYDSLPLSDVVLSEDSLVDFVVNQDVLKLEDELCRLTTTFVCNVEALFGKDFFIEFLKDGSWYRLPNKSFTEQAFFGQIGREEGDGLYLKEWYSNLEPGTYRVVKRIGVNWYGDEFIIE